MGLFALVGHQAQHILGRVGVDELPVKGHLQTQHKLSKAGEPSHKHLHICTHTACWWHAHASSLRCSL